MSDRKDSFILYADYAKYFQMLDMEQRGRLITAIFSHVCGDESPDGLDLAAGMAFQFIRDQIDRDRASYEEKCAKNQEAARKRWEKIRKALGDANAYERIETDANAYERVLYDTDTDSDSDTDTDSVSGSESPEEREPLPTELITTEPPTLEEIRKEVDQNGYRIDPLKFYQYYGRKGWEYKGQPIAWRERLREWNRTEKTEKPKPKKNQFTSFEQRPVEDDFELNILKMNGYVLPN